MSKELQIITLAIVMIIIDAAIGFGLVKLWGFVFGTSWLAWGLQGFTIISAVWYGFSQIPWAIGQIGILRKAKHTDRDK